VTAVVAGLVAENSCFIVGTEELSSTGASIGSALPPRGLLEGRGVLREAAAAGGRNEMSQYSYCKAVGYKTITQQSPTGPWLTFDFLFLVFLVLETNSLHYSAGKVSECKS
jgi:hypothetical protein